MDAVVRRPERKAAVIAAARRVVGKRGLHQANVRAIAAEAEMSAGNVLYYFPSLDSLIYACVESVLEEFYEQRRRTVSEMSEPHERLSALILAGIPDVISDDLRAVYESVSLIRERPHYAPLYRSIVERQVLLYQTTIEIGTATGAFRPHAAPSVIARNLVALKDAYDLYPLVGVELDRAECRAAVTHYAELALRVTLAA